MILTKKNKSKKKKNKKTLPIRKKTITWFLRFRQLFFFLFLLCILAATCGFMYLIMYIIIILIRSDHIKKTIHDIYLLASPKIFGALVTSLVLMISFLIYLSYTISSCRDDPSLPPWLLCNVHPRLGYQGTMFLKVLFLMLSAGGVSWAIYLHQDPSKITRWNIILLVILLFPLALLFIASILLFMYQLPIYYYY